MDPWSEHIIKSIPFHISLNWGLSIPHGHNLMSCIRKSFGKCRPSAVVISTYRFACKNANGLLPPCCWPSDGSGLKPGPGPARSPGSKARPELDFLGPDPSIGDGSGPRPARARPGARGHGPGPGPSF